MMARPKPWEARTPTDRLDAVRPLLAQGLAPSTIAFRLGAKPTEISRLASMIRREEWTKTEDVGDVETVETARTQIDPPSLAPEIEGGGDFAPITFGGDIDGAVGAVAEIITPAADEASQDAAPAVPAEDQPSINQVIEKYEGTIPDWRAIPQADRNELLAEYCQKGLTASAIAAKFVNCSRSAVIGLVHRLKLQFNNGVPRKGKVGRRPASEAAAPKPPKAPAVRRVSKLVQQNVSWRGANNPHRNDIKGRIEQRAASPGLPAHLVAGEPRRPVNDLNIVPVSRNLKLIELTEQTCKWPIGDPQSKDFGFCGNDAQSTRPYCRYHTRISYEPLTTRQSAGLRSAERIS